MQLSSLPLASSCTISLACNPYDCIVVCSNCGSTVAGLTPGLHPERTLLAGLLHNIRCVAGVGVCRSISGTALPAFNKLRQAKRGAHAGIELLEQAQADNNVTTRLLNG